MSGLDHTMKASAVDAAVRSVVDEWRGKSAITEMGSYRDGVWYVESGRRKRVALIDIMQGISSKHKLDDVSAWKAAYRVRDILGGWA